MRDTIYNLTANGPVVVTLRNDGMEVYGDIAYRFARPEPFPSGIGQTLPRFARGVPVMFRDGEWKQTQLGNCVIRNWFDMARKLD
jgi:hypothetical protein